MSDDKLHDPPQREEYGSSGDRPRSVFTPRNPVDRLTAGLLRPWRIAIDSSGASVAR